MATEFVDEARIHNTFGKLHKYLSNHNSIQVSVSGGSDSTIIVHIIATYFREFLPKIHFVFSDTGLEFKATREFLKQLESKYDIKIERVRGKSVPYICKQYGIPILSKEFSERIYRTQYNPDSESTKKWWQATRKESKGAMSDTQRRLANYLMENNIRVSSKCCDYSKKKPMSALAKKYKVDLSISGERQAEGGIRAMAHTDCFEEHQPNSRHDYDKYMPLWFWNDMTKQYYKESEGIVYSDCYEVYGMKRTGCVGCPFNSRVGDELAVMKKYEPNLYTACMNVFGKSYELMDKFNVHRQKIFKDSLF